MFSLLLPMLRLLLLMLSLLLLNLSPWPMHSLTHPFTNIQLLLPNPTHDLPFQPIFIVPVFYVPMHFTYLCAYLPSRFTCPCSCVNHFYALYCLCLYTFCAFVCVSYLHCAFYKDTCDTSALSFVTPLFLFLVSVFLPGFLCPCFSVLSFLWCCESSNVQIGHSQNFIEFF